MSIYDKIVETAITFDDVLLVPSYSEVLPNQVSLKSRLSDKITLNVPIVSAAMDTVTEADMAIALARVGGLGFIHKNMPIEEQASQVNQVKRSENGMIANPVTLSKDHTLAEAKALMAQFKISGLPVVDEEHKLIGIITNRDVKYQENLSVKVEELMTKENLIVSNEEVNLEKAKEYLTSGQYLWNSGMFVWKASTILKNFKEYLPEIYEGLQKIGESINTEKYEEVLRKEFPNLPSESIDYGIMEKAKNIYVIPGNFGWDDVGSWLSLERINKTNQDGNVISGNVISIKTKNSIIQGNEKLIATIGLEDIVIVDTEDVTLICHKNNSQEVKEIINNLRICNRNEYL